MIDNIVHCIDGIKLKTLNLTGQGQGTLPPVVNDELQIGCGSMLCMCALVLRILHALLAIQPWYQEMCQLMGFWPPVVERPAMRHNILATQISEECMYIQKGQRDHGPYLPMHH